MKQESHIRPCMTWVQGRNTGPEVAKPHKKLEAGEPWLQVIQTCLIQNRGLFDLKFHGLFSRGHRQRVLGGSAEGPSSCGVVTASASWRARCVGRRRYLCAAWLEQCEVRLPHGTDVMGSILAAFQAQLQQNCQWTSIIFTMSTWQITK